MKKLFRVLFALMIVLALVFALCFAISADDGGNDPAEVETAPEEDGLSRVQALWLALTPSVGAVIAAAVVAYKDIKAFKDLRADLIADGEIAAIKKETKALQKSIERLTQIQENETKDTESLKRSIKSMEITAQKLDLHMTRIEAKMGAMNNDQEV